MKNCFLTRCLRPVIFIMESHFPNDAFQYKYQPKVQVFTKIMLDVHIKLQILKLILPQFSCFQVVPEHGKIICYCQDSYITDCEEYSLQSRFARASRHVLC